MACIPGIEGMIWSGTAIGDWTLSCVTGKLESVTFVFEDGTIQTLASDDNQRGFQGNSAGEAITGRSAGFPMRAVFPVSRANARPTRLPSSLSALA